MDFLNKLYESNYFGIGLFAVISFLVVAFLIVLFFGKKDEKKRKMENLNISTPESNSDDTFKETTPLTPIEVPTSTTDFVAPVAPINYDTPSEPTTTISANNIGQPQNIDLAPTLDAPVAPVNPLPSVNPVVEPVNIVTPTRVTPIVEEPITPIINQEVEPIKPIIEEPVVPIISEPVINPVTPTISEPTFNNAAPTINPVTVEPTRYSIPNEPKVMEPIKITIPEEPSRVSPIIEPVISETSNSIPNYEEPTPIIEEPVINETYYKPVEKVELSNINVPNIDFDAIAKSISKELDELENTTTANTPKIEPVRRPTTNQFSSVYVQNGPKPTPPENMEMPKKIDLPTKKDE